LFPGHSGEHGNEITDEYARSSSAHQFVGPEPTLGILRQNIRHRIKDWLFNQHVTLWLGLNSTQKQAQEFILGPNLAAKPRLLSFNRIQSRVIKGLLTGCSNPRRHFYKMVQIESLFFKKCEPEEETSAQVMCKCEALATLKHTYMGFFFLDPEDVRNLSLGATETLLNRQDSHDSKSS